jgi:broad specificity phosphatase PhoE
MCRIRFAVFAILLGFCPAADIANAGDAEAWRALHAGRHVALMRHTDAPGGDGDPPGFRLDDCATQHNLSAKGRADAARIGARLRSEGIAVEKILSSPWCRCMDTAKLAELGAVEAEPTFGNVVVLSDQRASLTAGARSHRQMERKRNPSCRDARRKHFRSHRHLAGERRDRCAPKRKRR